MNINKSITPFSLVAALCVAVGSSWAAQNDPLLFFSTPGPDTYKDGTKVLDGECYALVWVKTDCTFAGINADGTAVDAVNNAVLTINPLAANGCCPETGFQIPIALAEQYTNGCYMLCLLDTRGADDKVLGVDAEGKVRAVNGYGLVEGASVRLAAGDITSLSGSDPVVTETESAIPEGTPNPVIKEFSVKNGKAYITVSGTVSCLKYNASRGETPDAIGKTADDVRCADPVQGDATKDITIIVPVNQSSGFYCIRRD